MCAAAVALRGSDTRPGKAGSGGGNGGGNGGGPVAPEEKEGASPFAVGRQAMAELNEDQQVRGVHGVVFGIGGNSRREWVRGRHGWGGGI